MYKCSTAEQNVRHRKPRSETANGFLKRHSKVWQSQRSKGSELRTTRDQTSAEGPISKLLENRRAPKRKAPSILFHSKYFGRPRNASALQIMSGS